MPKPRFEVIKNHLLNKINNGQWRPGDPVLSENQLAEQFEVSRMTARRALSELTDSGVLERIRGVGTFVAEQLPTGSLLRIRNIAEEIVERGHRHRSEVLCLEKQLTDEHSQHLLALAAGTKMWFSRLLHFENDTPIQIEDRYVNADIAPKYLEQDFTLQTPSAYLSNITPLSEADHWVEAVTTDENIRKLLNMKKTQPCLKVSRRTYSHVAVKRKKVLQVVNFAYLYHPGDRYRLGGHLQF